MSRTLWINLRNTLILLCGIYFAIPIVHESSVAIRKAFFPKSDPRAALPNYRDLSWAQEHFRELNETRSEFRAFVGWRREPFSGRTIQLDPELRIRLTPHAPGVPAHPATYFFGGSAIWGIGADDAGTIPAFYEQIARRRAENLGEIGWTAHQSLNELQRLVSQGERPEAVVFYDGANEVQVKCRVENDFFSHFKVQDIQAALQYKPNAIGYYARPLQRLGRTLGVWLGYADESDEEGGYDCGTDSRKASLVAQALIDDWALARQIVASYGGVFHAFLQPVSYWGEARVDHLPVDAALREQYLVVYPLIRARMEQAGLGEDLERVLDGEAYAYIDFCHLSPGGNQLVASEIARRVGAP